MVATAGPVWSQPIHQAEQRTDDDLTEPKVEGVQYEQNRHANYD
jgi:hypothetical protein